MPLPPMPANNTDRTWLKYTSMGKEHELCLRFPNATPQADIAAQLAALANSLKAYMLTTDSFLTARHSDNGSNLSFPLTFTAVAGTGAQPTETDDGAKFMSLTGRSISGYDCRVTFFCPFVPDTLGYRVIPANYAGAATFRSAITAIAPAPIAVNGQSVIWNGYVNIGYNAYWQRELR